MSRRTERTSERTWSPLAASGPPARWTPMRKAMVVRAILADKLDGPAARLRFDLAEEELSGWLSRYVEHGVKGLHTTQLQNYRTHTADHNVPRRGRAEKICPRSG
jgi:hypothetical protein